MEINTKILSTFAAPIGFHEKGKVVRMLGREVGAARLCTYLVLTMLFVALCGLWL